MPCEYPECGCEDEWCKKLGCKYRPAVILDLPVPLEPVIVDLARPLADQLPAGAYLEAARKMLSRDD